MSNLFLEIRSSNCALFSRLREHALHWKIFNVHLSWFDPSIITELLVSFSIGYVVPLDVIYSHSGKELRDYGKEVRDYGLSVSSFVRRAITRWR